MEFFTPPPRSVATGAVWQQSSGLFTIDDVINYYANNSDVCNELTEEAGTVSTVRSALALQLTVSTVRSAVADQLNELKWAHISYDSYQFMYYISR